MPPDEMGEGETLPAEDRPGADRPANPPAADWSRYELLDLLGTGGMGRVYRARDRRLDRMVAIKLIVGLHADLAMRLLREARAQARLDHPNICRVYEVGEESGRPYIALQLLRGEPLHMAAVRMTLAERVGVMRDVAAAIHEAHRLGVVHRDLKPANIMVERGEGGPWVPVVMDFGLAREAAVESRLSESGVPLGTPSYMSPEQARGDLRAIDARSDVYNLGATLYELLTGRPPFTSPSVMTTLTMVLDQDPAPPRALAPGLPADLETIALRCLAKEPGRRYASARELADDLGRFLAGQPILGRRPSPWQRLRARIRRHRPLIALGASSLAVIAAVSVFGGRAWLSSRAERDRAAERARLAERLGRQGSEIEMLLRSSEEAPLHDTRPDRERVRARLRGIAATPHALGDPGRALVQAAVGRTHLALREWGDAAAAIQRAAALGLETAALHAALGRAYGEMYQAAFEVARRSGDSGWRARRRLELERTYLSPALRELQASRALAQRTGDPADEADPLEVLIALYRRDFAAAEAKAREMARRLAWSLEARKLAADAAYRAAVDAFDRGDDDAAEAGLERAAALYEDVSEIARSDASIHLAMAMTALQQVELAHRRGRSPRERLERGLAAVERALVADPDSAPALATRAHLLARGNRRDGR